MVCAGRLLEKDVKFVVKIHRRETTSDFGDEN